MHELTRPARLLADVFAARLHARGSILRVQAARLQRLVTHAKRRSAFYRELYSELPATWSLADLPPVDKTTLMREWDRVITDPGVRKAALLEFMGTAPAHAEPRPRLFGGDIFALKTSGTSGETGLFPYRARDIDRVMAMLVARQPRRSRPLRRRRVAFIGIVGPHHAGWALAQSFPRWAVEMAPIMCTDPVAQWLRRLDELQPDAITGYATPVQIAARAQLEGRVRIRPHEVTVSAEPLTAQIRRDIVDAWGVTPAEHWLATEALGLTSPCTHGRTHVNEDAYIVEPAGDHVYVTSLLTPLFPIIRYRLPDQVRLSAEPCNCGRQMQWVKSIEGRAGDVIWLVGPDGVRAALLPQFIAAFAADGLVGSQLVQEQATHLRLRLVTLAGAEDRVRRAGVAYLAGWLQRNGLAGHVGVDVETVPAIASDPVAGKQRLTVPLSSDQAAASMPAMSAPPVT